MFRKWCAISAIAGALERRVFTATLKGPVFPNLFVLLVAPPGIGKYIIEDVRNLWDSVRDPVTKSAPFHVAPDSMTKASLVDSLSDAKTVVSLKDGTSETYHSLLIAAEEFSVLMPEYDMAYVGFLNSIWNNKSLHSERRRYGHKQVVDIINPQLNILGGIQPAFMSTIFPDDNRSTGFARRILMIWAAEAPIQSLFFGDEPSPDLRTEVLRHLTIVSQLRGWVPFEPAAAKLLDDWYLAGKHPVPMHSKLVDYNNSRALMILKLALVASVMRCGLARAIEEADVKEAMGWLFEAEALMPDIFRAMVGRSDREIIEELHQFVLKAYNTLGRKPIPDRVIWSFLKDRAPSLVIERIVQTAERSGLMVRLAGTETWKPGGREGREAE